jgi:tRNA (uracil-5-)-methyltransferase TRM9
MKMPTFMQYMTRLHPISPQPGTKFAWLPHFYSLRFLCAHLQPWPIIASFLESIPTGWIGLDSGTGNGKYLPLPLNRPPGSVHIVGLDRSRKLLEIAQTAGIDDNKSGKASKRDVVWGDVLDRCWRYGALVRSSTNVDWTIYPDVKTCFQDYAISIATIHHLATTERRRDAVKVCESGFHLYNVVIYLLSGCNRLALASMCLS